MEREAKKLTSRTDDLRSDLPHDLFPSGCERDVGNSSLFRGRRDDEAHRGRDGDGVSSLVSTSLW